MKQKKYPTLESIKRAVDFLNRLDRGNDRTIIATPEAVEKYLETEQILEREGE